MKYTLNSILLLVCLLSCAQNEQVRDVPFTGTVIESEKQKFGIDTLTKELANPWGIAFLPDGRILVTERAGEIRIVKDGKLLAEKIGNVPPVYANGQGGLMDIKLHPDYTSNGWIYLSYSRPGPGGGGTVISRAKLDGNNLANLEELFVSEPFSASGVHFGSRIVFDGKGHIFFSSGERGKMVNAQDLTNHLGKMLRLNEDGTVPADNPFVSTPNARPEIWSYGHRNPQGIVFDKATQTLWAVEHGPKGGDELNKVEPGKNYGWPVITYGINYDGTIISNLTEKEGMEQPVFYWVPSIAPCGMAMVTSDRYPNWKGNLMVTALALQHIARVELDRQGYFLKQERLLDNIGRVRAIEQSPDGYLYLATESPGMLLKIVPVN